MVAKALKKMVEQHVLRSFLNGKAVIPRYTFFANISTNISQSSSMPTSLPRLSPTSLNQKKNRPDEREKMRKRKISEYVEELIQNNDLINQEFPVDNVIILRDENGKFIGFKIL